MYFFSRKYFNALVRVGQAAATDGTKAMKMECIFQEISDLVGVKFVADDPILFNLAFVLTAVQENKNEIQSEIQSFKTEILCFKHYIKSQQMLI